MMSHNIGSRDDDDDDVGADPSPVPSSLHLQHPADQSELATPWSLQSLAVHADDSPLRIPSHVPEQFLLPEHLRPTVKHDDYLIYNAHEEIPVIDMAACNLDGDVVDVTAMETVVAQVRDACLNWGFFEIINHGVEEELLSRVLRQATRFFTLPYLDKMKVVKPPGKYSGYGHATVKEGDVRPWSEGFYFTDETTTAEFAQTLWPEDNNDFV